MKALLTKDYIEEFDMRLMSKSIMKLFDDYNYKCTLAQNIMEASLSRELSDVPSSFQHRKSDPTLTATIKREKLLQYINEFDRKLKYLKATFTDDELKIFHYAVEERETDKELCDRLAKSYKTVYMIKKSCYVKISLRFGLVDGLEKTIMTTISVLD